MADFKLHCFAQSGNAYKAALLLSLCEADWEPVFVDFFNGEARSDAYKDVNEMGEVPVLTHGKTRLTQSGVMLDYLSKHFGKFGPATEEERLEINRWLFWDNHKLTANIATSRFMLNFVPEEKRNADIIAFLLGRAKGAMGILEARLEGRDWIATDQLSIADLSCVGYMYYLDELDIDAARDFPNIARWKDAISALPGWKHPYDMMPGHPLEG